MNVQLLLNVMHPHKQLLLMLCASTTIPIHILHEELELARGLTIGGGGVSGIDIRDTQSKEVSAHADFPGWLETYKKVSPDPKAAGSVSPDLEAVGSVSPNPLAVGSVSPDPLGAGSISPDPKAIGSVSPKVIGSLSTDPLSAGSVSLDPLGAGSISPDPKDVVFVSPKVTGTVSPDLEDTGSVSSDGDPYRLQPLQVQAYGLRSKP